MAARAIYMERFAFAFRSFPTDLEHFHVFKEYIRKVYVKGLRLFEDLVDAGMSNVSVLRIVRVPSDELARVIIPASVRELELDGEMPIDPAFVAPGSLRKLVVAAPVLPGIFLIPKNITFLGFYATTNSILRIPRKVSRLFFGDKFDSPVSFSLDRDVPIRIDFGNRYNQATVLPTLTTSVVFGDLFNRTVDFSAIKDQPVDVTFGKAYTGQPKLPPSTRLVIFRDRGRNVTDLPPAVETLGLASAGPDIIVPASVRHLMIFAPIRPGLIIPKSVVRLSLEGQRGRRTPLPEGLETLGIPDSVTSIRLTNVSSRLRLPTHLEALECSAWWYAEFGAAQLVGKKTKVVTTNED